MKTKLALTAFAAAIAVFSQGAFAQASSPTRAAVKAEAKTGSLAPAGQGPGASSPPSTGMSTKTRAERKGETQSARSTDALKPAGEAAEMKDDKADKMKGSNTTRAERKATTKEAVKTGQTQPAGEAPNPVAAPKKP